MYAAELMRQMEAAGLEARVALRRKADEEQLTILHFRRRPEAAHRDREPVGRGVRERGASECL